MAYVTAEQKYNITNIVRKYDKDKLVISHKIKLRVSDYVYIFIEYPNMKYTVMKLPFMYKVYPDNHCIDGLIIYRYTVDDLKQIKQRTKIEDLIQDEFDAIYDRLINKFPL